MSAKVTDSSIVRQHNGIEYIQYDVLQCNWEDNLILVSPVNSVEDPETKQLPGFWGNLEDFEVKVCRQHGSGHGVYDIFESISGFTD